MTQAPLALDQIRELHLELRRNIESVIVGQSEAITLLLVALLSEGHILFEGVPGTAKTLLARVFARSLNMEFTRMQFTPDLLPGDLLGTNLFDFKTSQFRLTKGPIFTELLLADEINRTPPKTQAALLEAMQERTVTIDGQTHGLSQGFMVVATQNPLEQEGTYPLPEAQLDRFLFKVILDYPSRDEERELVRRHGQFTRTPSPERLGVKPILGLEAVLVARESVRQVTLSDAMIDYIVDIVRATRTHPSLYCGASPRAANMLAASSRAYAALHGRGYVLPDDVKALAAPALSHRLVLSPAAEIEGLRTTEVLERIVLETAAPR